MASAAGRPRKYVNILAALNDHDLYSPALIARTAKDEDLLGSLLEEETNEALVQKRIRVAMIRSSKIYGFPPEGDGLVRLVGQAPVPGWFGWRWKKILKGKKPMPGGPGFAGHQRLPVP